MVQPMNWLLGSSIAFSMEQRNAISIRQCACRRKDDVRAVAGTSRDPGAEKAAQRLREDLYPRFTVMTVRLPA